VVAMREEIAKTKGPNYTPPPDKGPLK